MFCKISNLEFDENNPLDHALRARAEARIRHELCGKGELPLEAGSFASLVPEAWKVVRDPAAEDTSKASAAWTILIDKYDSEARQYCVWNKPVPRFCDFAMERSGELFSPDVALSYSAVYMTSARA